MTLLIGSSPVFSYHLTYHCARGDVFDCLGEAWQYSNRVLFHWSIEWMMSTACCFMHKIGDSNDNVMLLRFIYKIGGASSEL